MSVERKRNRREWRLRWLVTRGGAWNRLHRVTGGKYTEEYLPVGIENGKSLCGITGDFAMPGIFSRMVLRRCAHCCRIAGIPQGSGAPFNSLKGTKEANA
jgi:hypothetical protein